MIRSGIGTDPEVLRHHPLAQRVAGAECRELVSAFSPCHALCQWVVTKVPRDLFRSPTGSYSFLPFSSKVVADQREAVGGCWFRLSGFPS